NAVLRPSDQGEKGRTQFHVYIMGHDDILTFANKVGAAGAYRSAALAEAHAYINQREANTNRDIIPRELWRNYAVPAMQRNGVTLRRMQQGLGVAFMGTSLYKQNVSRERLARLVTAVGGDDTLSALATSDIYWDQIRSIDLSGEEEVF